MLSFIIHPSWVSNSRAHTSYLSSFLWENRGIHSKSTAIILPMLQRACVLKHFGKVQHVKHTIISWDQSKESHPPRNLALFPFFPLMCQSKHPTHSSRCETQHIKARVSEVEWIAPPSMWEHTLSQIHHIVILEFVQKITSLLQSFSRQKATYPECL